MVNYAVFNQATLAVLYTNLIATLPAEANPVGTHLTEVPLRARTLHDVSGARVLITISVPLTAVVGTVIQRFAIVALLAVSTTNVLYATLATTSRLLSTVSGNTLVLILPPVVIKLPPTVILLATPTPPATTNAPVVVLVDATLDLTTTLLPVVALIAEPNDTLLAMVEL